MKIGIISDTHGNLEIWEKIISTVFKDVELIIHCGDVFYGASPEIEKQFIKSIKDLQIPILAAKGNCDEIDGNTALDYASPYGTTQINNKKILYTHGQNYSSAMIRFLIAKEQSADIFISGHTHIPYIEEYNGVIFLNPGSPNNPRSSDKMPTVVILEDNKFTFINCNNMKTVKEFSI